MMATITADFPEHRKKRIIEQCGHEELIKLFYDYERYRLTFAQASNSDDQRGSADFFLTVVRDTLDKERQSMEELIAMADAAKLALGIATPMKPPVYRSTAEKPVAFQTPLVIQEDEDNPLLAAMIAQEKDGSSLDPPQEVTKVHKDRSETYTAQGTRLALP